MRRIVRNGLGPIAALVCLASSSAAAETRTHAIVVGDTVAQRSAIDLEGQARAVAARMSSAHAASLVATSTDRFADGDAIVVFAQVHRVGGAIVPVIGRGVAVRLSSRAERVTTAVDLEDVLPSTVAPALAAPRAAAIASTRSAIGASAADAHLVVWPTRDGAARLAYAVLPDVPAGIPTRPRVIVDAETGAVLEARETLVFANQAQVYRFNPTKTPNLETVDLPIAPVDTTLTNPFVRSTNCIDEKSVRPVSFFGINTKVHVCDLVQTASANASGDWIYPPEDTPGTPEARKDPFSEVSMYYHATKAYEFFRGLAGDAAAQVTVDKPLPVVANLQIPAGIASFDMQAAADPNKPLDPFQNAFFSPAGGGLGQIFQQLYGVKSGALWFGQGPTRDYSYDGDVVYHEFTHAVVDKTLRLGAWHVDARGAIDAPGAMNEALADYFSSAITGDPDVGEYASKDISQNLGVIRTLANDDKCPAKIAGEVHFDSTLFSGGLWQARSSLAEGDRTKFDAALYKAMRLSAGDGDLGYEDLTKLFMTVLGTDLPAGAKALETAMTSRGVLPACERILEAGGAPVAAPESGMGGFVAPGTQSVSIGGIAPGIVQIHAKFAKPAAQATVTFTEKKQAGGGAALGGQATPFTPMVLAKFGKAITWTSNAKKPNDADVQVAAKTGARWTATFDVPEGATDVYVQIANKGESDGIYDAIAVDLTPRSVDPTAPPEDPAAPPTTEPSSDSGCGCSTPGRSTTGAGALSLAALAAAAAVAGMRRRRSRE